MNVGELSPVVPSIVVSDRKEGEEAEAYALRFKNTVTEIPDTECVCNVDHAFRELEMLYKSGSLDTSTFIQYVAQPLEGAGLFSLAKVATDVIRESNQIPSSEELEDLLFHYSSFVALLDPPKPAFLFTRNQFRLPDVMWTGLSRLPEALRECFTSQGNEVAVKDLSLHQARGVIGYANHQECDGFVDANFDEILSLLAYAAEEDTNFVSALLAYLARNHLSDETVVKILAEAQKKPSYSRVCLLTCKSFLQSRGVDFFSSSRLAVTKIEPSSITTRLLYRLSKSCQVNHFCLNEAQFLVSLPKVCASTLETLEIQGTGRVRQGLLSQLEGLKALKVSVESLFPLRKIFPNVELLVLKGDVSEEMLKSLATHFPQLRCVLHEPGVLPDQFQITDLSFGPEKSIPLIRPQSFWGWHGFFGTLRRNTDREIITEEILSHFQNLGYD